MSEDPSSIGPYRILSQVGEGGMGIVYKARDERIDRVVALKVVREAGSDSGRRNRFLQEARTAAQVAHPNACRIYDITDDQNRLVIVMEFIEGESLAVRIERGPLPAQEAAQIVLSVLSALEAFSILCARALNLQRSCGSASIYTVKPQRLFSPSGVIRSSLSLPRTIGAGGRIATCGCPNAR
jgi:serine/threonine protein kinase